MLTFTTNEFIQEQYFLACNVQAIKLIANRRIYGCGFRVTCLVRIFSNKNICDRLTDVCIEKERERKRKTRSTKGRCLFYEIRRELQWTISSDVLRRKRKAFLDYNCGNDAHRENDLRR